jgi:hypothetical protein
MPATFGDLDPFDSGLCYGSFPRRCSDPFLKTAEDRKGASGAEVQSNITDNESAKIKGPHGSIQGYKGIAVAHSANQVIVVVEACGSGRERKRTCYRDGG